MSDKDWSSILDYLRPKDPLYCPEEASVQQQVFLRTNAIEALFGGAAGGGKAVYTFHTVATPSGFVPMADIHPGDFVIGRDGKPHVVLAESEVMELPGWTLTFDDGSQVTVNDEHLWLTFDSKELAQLTRLDPEWRARRRAKRPSRATGSQGERKSVAVAERNALHPPKTKSLPEGTVRTTAEIVASLRTPRGRTNHAIPVAATIDLPHRDLIVDPYVLGAWLGDGFSGRGAVCGADPQVFAEIERFYERRATETRGESFWVVTYLNLSKDLRAIGVFNNKYIPNEYLWASEEQRLALLQGLLDTDGTVAKNSGAAEFTNTNRLLAEGVAHLARSLGMKATIREGRSKLNGRDCGPKWTVKFVANRPVFRLERKLALQKISERRTAEYRYVVDAERVDPLPMKCIKVSSPDHLYLVTENFIPTHNSSALLMAALQYPLAIDTPVATTSGWSTIGDIQPGEFVFDENGQPVKVVAKTDRFVGDCYELQFGNGERIVADANHLWAVHSFQDRMAEGGSWYPTRRDLQIHTTAELADTILTNHKRAKTNWSIPAMGQIDLPDADLPLDPYLLGVWLGDGSHSSGTIAGIDPEIRQFFDDAGYVTQQYSEYHFHVTGLVGEIRSLGLFKNKHVPELYLRGSAKQRLALLQGLMDTDGTVNRYGGCRFFNTNERLIDAVYEIVASLGANPRRGKQKYTIPSGEKKTGFYVDWPSSFHAFRLKRKAEKQVLRSPRERTIQSITKVDDRAVQCIVVDSPSHLFAVGRSFMLTHNCDVPGYNAMLFRRTFADLALPEALMDRFIKWIAPYEEIKWNGSSYTATFPSGARISFGYLNNKEDYLRYKGCVAESTEVLTATGWKQIQDIQVGEMVASMDPSTRTWDYQPVTHIWKYDHDGPLYGPRPGSDVSFAVTENHTWWASTRKKPDLRKYRTDELPKVACFPQAARFVGGINPGAALFPRHAAGWQQSGDLLFSPEDWATLLGWYIAEGNTDRSSIRVSLHDGHSRVFKNGLRLLLERSGAHVGADPRGLRFTNGKLAEWLNEHTGKGAYNKRIPDEVFSWEERLATMLLESLVEGDGTWRSRTNGHFVTVSRELADGVMRLGQHCGFRATLDVRDDQTRTPDGKAHEVRAFHVHLTYKADSDTGISLNVDNQPIVANYYTGKVYCLTVPPHHTFLMRYNGRVVWTGNSELQFIGMDEVTEIRESDYRYMFSRLRRPSSGPLSKVPLRMRAATNPAPNWVRQRFIVEGREYGRVFVPSKLTDNPGIDAESYRRALAELDPIERRRLEEGDWWVTSLGSMFRREDFAIIGPEEVPSFVGKASRLVRFWDLAATEVSNSNTDPDWTVGTLMMFDEGIAYILDVRRARQRPEGVERLVAQTAIEDGPAVAIRMEQEPGSSGKIALDQYARFVVPGYDVMGIRATGDKVSRARPFASAVANGNVRIVRGPWLTEWLDEFTSFPEASAHDDQVDSAVGAFTFLTGLGLPQRRRATIIV